MTFSPEVMTPAQQDVLRRLAPLAVSAGFYLAGGTAVALQLGHRRSIDLDWFTPGEIADPSRLAGELHLAPRSIAKGTLHADSDGVHLSFLEYRYPQLQPFAEWPEYACRLAALEDLACMKLSALASRGARKDFIDVYALGRAGFTLSQMLALYQEKYQTRDVGHVVYSLTYFDDAEAEDTPEMLWNVEWKEIRATIQGWVRDLR